MSDSNGRSFANPYEVEPPVGAEEWRRLYPHYYLFDEERRPQDEQRFWFYDGMHNPTALYPFDTIMTESWWVALNQGANRVWRVPPSRGLDQRLLNGYLYCSPREVHEPEELEARAPVFAERAQAYFEDWPAIYDAWVAKAGDCIERLKAISFAVPPTVEPDAVVSERRALTSAWQMLADYNRLIENMQEMAHYHFEMLTLGYGAYLTFRDLCAELFPDIDNQTITRMVSGQELVLFRPDAELRKLARLAHELELQAEFGSDGGPDTVLERLGASEAGRRWIDALEAAKEPWFWYSTGAGYSHQDRAWMDDMRVPFTAIRGYLHRLDAGEEIDLPTEQLRAEGERLAAEYEDVLGSEEERDSFRGLLELSRTVYPYVENHNFYVEHWHHTIFFNKVRELGGVLAACGVLAESEDIFYLHRFEIPYAIYELAIDWAIDGDGPTSHWRAEVDVRRDILERLSAWSPPPALGPPPEQITESYSIMLYGITTEAVRDWLGDGDETGEDGRETLRGIAASPGVVEGVARVVADATRLDEVQQGEILVSRCTTPSWAPVFGRVTAAVADIGGVMSHAAIVAREYGLPAVVGTGFGTTRIRTGQRIRVDGGRGVVELIDEETTA
ncbi:MAG: pyruvate, water dikinase [Solirubrobacteraceae bacterium]|nr:pyruvate, water dikinase [Solirubrobacteraceae bacterium]